jgi:hypothetical protein
LKVQEGWKNFEERLSLGPINGKVTNHKCGLYPTTAESDCIPHLQMFQRLARDGTRIHLVGKRKFRIVKQYEQVPVMEWKRL